MNCNRVYHSSAARVSLVGAVHSLAAGWRDMAIGVALCAEPVEGMRVIVQEAAGPRYQAAFHATSDGSSVPAVEPWHDGNLIGLSSRYVFSMQPPSIIRRERIARAGQWLCSPHHHGGGISTLYSQRSAARTSPSACGNAMANVLRQAWCRYSGMIGPLGGGVLRSAGDSTLPVPPQHRHSPGHVTDLRLSF